MKVIFLISMLFISACGDMSLVDVSTDVGKSDIEKLQQEVDAAKAEMQVLQQQNEQLIELLKACGSVPMIPQGEVGQ